MSMTYYTVYGSAHVCGHKHKIMRGALVCLQRDIHTCKEQGRVSSSYIATIDGDPVRSFTPEWVLLDKGDVESVQDSISELKAYSLVDNDDTVRYVACLEQGLRAFDQGEKVWIMGDEDGYHLAVQQTIPFPSPFV